jgi:trigger factor
MPYTLTHRANHTVEISAHLDSVAVDRERDDIVRSFRGKARVPGFRPGKAPAAAVRARFADEIRDELQEHLTGLLWREVFEGETEIQPITNPQIRDLSFAEDGGFSFTAELEVRPQYELPEIDDLSLPEISLEVGEAEIDDELTKVQEEQGAWEPSEDDEVADGMLVEVDLKGELEDSDDEPYNEEGASFIVGSDSAPPEVNEALQGARVGDVRTATKVLPDDLEDKDKAGKTVTYTISVKGLKRKVLPEIDDDLATTIGLENLEALRQRVKDVLEQQKRGERRNSWRRVVLDHLETDIDQAELPSCRSRKDQLE